MDAAIGALCGRAIVELISLGIQAAVVSSRSRHGSPTSISSIQQQTIPISLTIPSLVRHERAVLVAASSITFGNDCERLVNIAFQTSQTFPTMMGTYADVIEYLHKELIKHYTDECFHIIIGENHGFGFSIDDSQYFAEIAQKRYQVLIFSNKTNSNTKMDIHDTDTRTSFVWN